MPRRKELTATIEPFDSFWEAPDDIEKGYHSFWLFYKDNYQKYFPSDKQAKILCVSCGPGYGVKLLADLGYQDVLGIDSFEDKIAFATAKKLNCRMGYAFEFLQDAPDESYDLIWLEQEVNHLTRSEILEFLALCLRKLRRGGRLIAFALNGANPITGAEALAQNFDHFNTFTEYTLRQVLNHTGFEKIEVFDLNLYVFYKNPFNYVGMAASAFLSMLFRACFLLYGKKNRLFGKKIAASCLRPA
ncbi:MAG TPA: class I SAM-dependent methyltransferase [Steroidobacteraceae bacterium]|nr:class I SAM-dependent methyltransferase [Steroidobacteraceae bacterium]